MSDPMYLKVLAMISKLIHKSKFRGVIKYKALMMIFTTGAEDISMVPV